MKFKSLFLGTLAAAALVGCNNEVENGIEPIASGGSTNVTFMLEKAKTYAHTIDPIAGAGEGNVANATVYIYDAGASDTLQALCYVPSFQTTTTTTLRVKSGDKLIFAALNTRSANAMLWNANSTAPTVSPAGSDPAQASGNETEVATAGDAGFYKGNSYTSADKAYRFNTLNNALYTSGTDFTLTEPSTSLSADGLIKALAGGSVTASNGLLVPPAASGEFLMTNWNGAVDNQYTPTGDQYKSTAKFTLKAGVLPSASAVVGSDNYVEISVQRAIAKGTMEFAANLGNVTNGLTAGSGKNAGTFYPTGKWAWGNIKKGTMPFQEWTGSDVTSGPWFNSTLAQDGMEGNTATWRNRYDNVRVFGSAINTTLPKNYGIPVQDVDNAIQATPNVNLGDYAYVTENTHAMTQMQDWMGFVVTSGVYVPSDSIISGVTPDPISPNTAQGTTSKAIANTKTLIQAYDTVYYYIKGTDTLFVGGSAVMADYYKYILLNADPAAQMAEDQSKGNLYAYAKGVCFYRVWIKDLDYNEGVQNRIALLRNHTYDVNVTKISGPGIADPGKIINPGEPVEAGDTHVTAVIKILDWHKVQQDTEVGTEK